MRARLAGEFLTSILLVVATACYAEAGPIIEIHYTCEGGERLLVVKSARGASVQLTNRSYDLKKAPSSIGQKFISSTAALIIDGSSAVFVADDRLDLGECLEVSRTQHASDWSPTQSLRTGQSSPPPAKRSPRQ